MIYFRTWLILPWYHGETLFFHNQKYIYFVLRDWTIWMVNRTTMNILRNHFLYSTQAWQRKKKTTAYPKSNISVYPETLKRKLDIQNYAFTLQQYLKIQIWEPQVTFLSRKKKKDEKEAKILNTLLIDHKNFLRLLELILLDKMIHI